VTGAGGADYDAVFVFQEEAFLNDTGWRVVPL
jgi:hypothetical protein